MKPQVKTALFKCGICFICLAMIVLSGMYLYPLNKVVYYVAMSCFVVVAVAYCAVDNAEHPHIERSLLVASIFLAVAVGLYLLYYTTGLSERFNDFDAIKTFIVGSGYWGYAVFVGLTVFEIVVLPIPSAITILLGVAIYGATVSFILSTIGTLTGSLISFVLGKVFGRRLCNFMFGAENTEKYAKILGEKGRFLFIIMLLFPAFPDDMLCMIAGITSMSYGYFMLVCLLTRPVMIGLTAYLGSGIIPFGGWGIPIWIALACLMFVIFLVVTKLKSRIENRRIKRGNSPKIT